MNGAVVAGARPVHGAMMKSPPAIAVERSRRAAPSTSSCARGEVLGCPLDHLELAPAGRVDVRGLAAAAGRSRAASPPRARTAAAAASARPAARRPSRRGPCRSCSRSPGSACAVVVPVDPVDPAVRAAASRRASSISIGSSRDSDPCLLAGVPPAEARLDRDQRQRAGELDPRARSRASAGSPRSPRPGRPPTSPDSRSRRASRRRRTPRSAIVAHPLARRPGRAAPVPCPSTPRRSARRSGGTGCRG